MCSSLYQAIVMCALLQKSKGGATIEAKPRIKKLGDVTKFMPVSLRVKRNAKDSTGRNIKSAREYRREAGVCCCDVNCVVVKLPCLLLCTAVTRLTWHACTYTVHIMYRFKYSYIRKHSYVHVC